MKSILVPGIDAFLNAYDDYLVLITVFPVSLTQSILVDKRAVAKLRFVHRPLDTYS